VIRSAEHIHFEVAILKQRQLAILLYAGPTSFEAFVEVGKRVEAIMEREAEKWWRAFVALGRVLEKHQL
jgi:hypothetical protein